MGIPYSREINAAFEQVTPLVAAGLLEDYTLIKVLRTTKNISILLAVIQVLTVFFLFLILLALIMLIYSVNPDLEKERREMVTPFMKYLAGISLWGFIRRLVSVLGGTALMLGGSWWLWLREMGEGVEHEGNEDADKALEEMDGKEKEKKKKEVEEKKKKYGKKDEKK